MTRTGQHQRCIFTLALGAMFVTTVIGPPAAEAQTYTVLHRFTGADGANPLYGHLIGDSAGNLYGTTASGGASGSGCIFGSGCGVVFKLDKTGMTVLCNFTGGADRANPYAGLVRDSAGNLYGTTANGGASGSGCLFGSGCGVVFKLDTAGTETVLYSFTGGADGANPFAGLIRDSAGNLYGTCGIRGHVNKRSGKW